MPVLFLFTYFSKFDRILAEYCMKNFITFEGGEKAGKTTLLEKLKQFCLENNIKAEFTREPGGLKECEYIRTLLKSSPNLSTKTQLLLFSACRSHLCENLIIPSVEQGAIVFCDRFFDSTRIYQGYCGELSDDEIMKVTKVAVQSAIPQLTFFLDIDPVEAFKRKGGADKGDVFEEKGIKFHQKIREGYNILCLKEPERFRKIDASQPADKVFSDVIEILKKEKVINA